MAFLPLSPTLFGMSILSRYPLLSNSFPQINRYSSFLWTIIAFPALLLCLAVVEIIVENAL